MRATGLTDCGVRVIAWGCASLSLLGLGLITLFLFREAFPLLQRVSAGAFLTGTAWHPTSDPPSLGILPMIAGSALVTAGSLTIAVPFGIAVALLISEVLPRGLKDPGKVAVEILAGIPSVVYGFFGLVVVGPWLQTHLNLPTGQTALAAAGLLGVMALPTVASVAEDALAAVPESLREASLALGATPWQSMWRVVLPAARSGVFAGAFLGMGRAIGETMTVLMVSGNSPVWPPSLLWPVRTMTATIALEMAEAPVGGLHYRALFAVGAILFLFTLLLNLVGDLVAHWVRRR
ncbi:MAG: phosphate ABC transporter permease subunit PstC [Candidatus Bipolaricaulaceae bacterium]